MKKSHSLFIWFLRVAGIALICTCVIVISSWIFTTGQLRAAREAGVTSTVEEGMCARIAENYIEPADYQIISAGTNSFDGSNSHVWYVVACVWGGHRMDGSPTGETKGDCDQPGHFFLNTKDGWVYIPEKAFPEFIGFWMDVFGLAGPG